MSDIQRCLTLFPKKGISMQDSRIKLYGAFYNLQPIIKLARDKYMETKRPVSVSWLIREITNHPVKPNGEKIVALANILKENNILVKQTAKIKDRYKVVPVSTLVGAVQKFIPFSSDTPTKKAINCVTVSKPECEIKTQTKPESRAMQVKKDSVNNDPNPPFVWCLRDEKGSLVKDQWDSPRFGPLLFSNKDKAKETAENHLKLTSDLVEVIPYTYEIAQSEGIIKNPSNDFDAASTLYGAFKDCKYTKATCRLYGDGRLSEISLYDANGVHINSRKSITEKDLDCTVQDTIAYSCFYMLSSERPILPKTHKHIILAIYSWCLDEDNKTVVFNRHINHE